MYSIYTPFDENSTTDPGLIALIALGNVVIVITLVVVMTVVLVCLYKHRCYKVRAPLDILILIISSVLSLFDYCLLDYSSLVDGCNWHVVVCFLLVFLCVS